MGCIFLDCFAGISGDMMLGALLDAGAPLDELLSGLRTMPLSHWDLRVERVRKGAIAATSVTIVADKHHHHERHLSDIQHIVNTSVCPNLSRQQAFPFSVSWRKRKQRCTASARRSAFPRSRCR
jgi:uncharacterized protein (DUF111 family)